MKRQVAVASNLLRVAVLADMLEEGWPSMDLVAEMLVERLSTEHSHEVSVHLVRPRMRRRVSGGRTGGPAFSADRVLNRFFDYPRHVRRMRSDFDVFHVVDHSYAHLVHALPPERTLVTCHDLDTFRSVLEPEVERRSLPFRLMTRRILAGLEKAGHIACVTEATRDGLVSRARIDPARTSVVHNGPHPSCTPSGETTADVEAARLLGGRRATLDLLHVGSTIARKRLDVLLRVFAGVRRVHPNARLVRVGGPFTAEQRALARGLHVDDAIVVLPFLDRATLASVYRQSALLLLPSEREGFGLPVLEALACATPVIASDIEALREVGGAAAAYCPPEDIEAWTAAVLAALTEREREPQRWSRRQDAGVERAAAFSWSRYAAELVTLYARLAGREAAAS